MSKTRGRFLLLLLIVLTALTAAGCSAAPGWEAKLDVTPAFETGSKLAIKLTVTEKGQPVTLLSVHATLEMARMEHDKLQVAFTESGQGVYLAEAALPMNGEWSADVEMAKNGVIKEQTFNFQTKIEASAPIAAVGDDIITRNDLDFYALANDVQGFLDKAPAQSHDKNALLTQIIRLKAVGLLAQEKGYHAEQAKVALELGKTRSIVEADPELARRIEQFDSVHFWNGEEARLTLLALAGQVQDEVRVKTKADHPQDSPKEISFQTAQAYEDLVVSQIGSIHIRFFM